MARANFQQSTVRKENPVTENMISEEQKRMEEERQKLVVQIVKLPNGATFTRLRPVTG